MLIKYKLINKIIVNHSETYIHNEDIEFNDLEDALLKYLSANGISEYHIDSVCFMPETATIVVGLYNCKHCDGDEVVYAENEICIIDVDNQVAVIEDSTSGYKVHLELKEGLLIRLYSWYSKFLDMN
jgi:hypothetical protein